MTGKLNGNLNFKVGVRGTAFATRDAGITLEIDPVIGADSWTIDMNFAYDNVDLTGATTFGSGISQLSQPIFYTQKISTGITIGDGTCALVAMTTPAPPGKDRPNYENDLRTLVFVRPAIMKQRPTIVGSFPEARQVSFLLEAIEMDNNAAAEMMQMPTDYLNDAPMRERALQLIAKGEATRRETSYLVTRSGGRARVASIEEIIYPSEADPPRVPFEARIDSDTAKLVVPVSCNSFDTQNIGTIFQLKPIVWAENAFDVEVTPQLSELLGWDSYGKKESKLEQPVFTVMKTSTSTTLIGGQAVLLSAHVPVDRKTQKPRRDRRVVLFLTSAFQEVKR